LLRQHGRAVPGGPPEALADTLRAALGARSVVVTLGASGAAVSTSDGHWHEPAPRVTVVDTTGAGDAFVGALAGILAAGRPLSAAVRAAGTAGARAVTYVGARAPDRAGVDAATHVALIGGETM
jgi:ribokinase